MSRIARIRSINLCHSCNSWLNLFSDFLGLAVSDLTQLHRHCPVIEFDRTVCNRDPSSLGCQVKVRRAFWLKPFFSHAQAYREFDQLFDRVGDQMTRRPMPPPVITEFIDIDRHNDQYAVAGGSGSRNLKLPVPTAAAYFFFATSVPSFRVT